VGALVASIETHQRPDLLWITSVLQRVDDGTCGVRMRRVRRPLNCTHALDDRVARAHP